MSHVFFSDVVLESNLVGELADNFDEARNSPEELWRIRDVDILLCL